MSAPLKVALLALNSPGYQSLALGYLRAYAQADRRLGGKVGFQTLDLTIDVDPWWVAWRVLGLEPDVLGVSVTCWNASAVYEVCRIVGQVRPECAVVLGGPEVGPIAEDVLREHPVVHAVVRGEGEVTFAEFLRALSTGGKTWRVEGVSARKGDEIFSAPDRALIADLDAIIHESDFVMVARGDLGVEISPEEVPHLQKQINTAANAAGQTVINATQLLESMNTNQRPTFADAIIVTIAITY